MTAVLVVLGALVGAPLRYVLDLIVCWWLRTEDDGVPWGTLMVNLLGSALIGLLAGTTMGRSDAGELTALVGTGLCGALTTFSALSYETARLIEIGQARAAAAYATGSLVAGVAVCSVAARWAGAIAIS